MAGSSPSSSRLTATIPSDYFWLSPSFDPDMTLAIELRRILQAHNIPLRNASTKAELVKLFKSRIQDNRLALLAAITPTSQAKPPSPKRGHRKAKPTAPAAESSSSSDASAEEEGSHDEKDDDERHNNNEANGVGAKQPSRPSPPRLRRTARKATEGTNGAHPAKDKGGQLEAEMERLMVRMDLERDHLQAVGDLMASVINDYHDTRKQMRKIHKKVKALDSLDR